MGTFRAGQWFICLLIYFIVFYLLVYSTFSLKASVYHTDPATSYTGDPTQTLAALNKDGVCDRPTEINLLGTIHCEDLDTNNGSCNHVAGCAWQNISHWFSADTQECTGDVNLTVFGLNGTIGCSGSYPDTMNNCLSTSAMCAAMHNQTYCDIFRCSWVNNSEIFNDMTPGILDTTKNIGMFWESAKFMLGFNTNLGFKSFGWLFAIFFTYIETIMLIYSGYMMIRGS